MPNVNRVSLQRSQKNGRRPARKWDVIASKMGGILPFGRRILTTLAARASALLHHEEIRQRD